jgi:hypothetical protein
MRYLSLMLLAPWLLVLAWAYWAYPKSLPRTALRRLFDMIALAAAFAASAWSALLAFDSVAVKQVGAFGPESGSIWKQVIPALVAYGLFAAVLALALAARRLLWRRRRPARH